jgi:hypothetical protein
MLQKVRHLIEWEEIEEKDVPAASNSSKSYTVVKAAGSKKAKKTGTKEPDGDET